MEARNRVVYALRCPHSGDIRYVGVTRCPKQRRIHHRSAKRSHFIAVDEWTSKLAAEGTPAIWEVLIAISGEHAGMATYIEEAVIAYMRKQGCNLLNADVPALKRRKHSRKALDQDAISRVLQSMLTSSEVSAPN
jgi:predicted GIY-YIG superfamily endonuclease